jgi:heme oxygenase
MILQTIKEQTSNNHTSLENSLLLRPITEKSLTLENYSYILQKFYGFFYPLELLVARYPIEQYLPDFVQRRKAGLLKNDWQQVTQDSHSSLPLCQDLPPVNNLEQAFGVFYVMEGSTLGGKMIYKIVRDMLGLDHQSGLSFFYGYGPDTGNKWKAFQQSLLNLSSENNAKDDQIIDSANNTFLKFKLWLER